MNTSLGEKFRKWKTSEAEKLSRMTFRKKVDHIFTYYKGWMFLFLVIILFCGYIGDAVISAHKEVILEGFFTNDDWNLFDADVIKKDYGEEIGLGKNQILILDDDLYIALNGDATEYTAASRGKIIAYMSTGELDFVITTGDVLDYYMNSSAVPMLPFDELLTPEQFEKYNDCLFIGPDTNREDSYIALDLTASRYVSGSGADTNPNITDTYYMFIPYNAVHTDQIRNFIDYMFS